MAEQITTTLGTVTLQVVTSSSSESQTVAWLHFLQRGQKLLTTNLQNVTFDLVDLFLLLLLPASMLELSEDCTECTPSLWWVASCQMWLWEGLKENSLRFS